MRLRTSLATLLTASLFAIPSADAAIVRVTITGEVDFNHMQFIAGPPIGDVVAGESVTTSFLIDTDKTVDGSTRPTRGYRIERDSFTMTFEAGVLGLKTPFPTGYSPYFVLHDAAQSGGRFHLSSNVDALIGVQLSQGGALGQYTDTFALTLERPLRSLDVLDALGSYDVDDVAETDWVLVDVAFEPVGN